MQLTEKTQWMKMKELTLTTQQQDETTKQQNENIKLTLTRYSEEVKDWRWQHSKKIKQQNNQIKI